MNPYRTVSSTHNVWPVVLIVYKMPHWMCMESDNFILSMVIPGPDSPSNDIDVYLEPLVDELILLWETGVQTFDISTNSNFIMRAGLLWTISDLPTLAYLSGWSTKGQYACLCCHKDTHSEWLKHGRKFCNMGHRRFLDTNHSFRSDERSFDGSKETRTAPVPLDGPAILNMFEGFEVKFGKKYPKQPHPFNLKKISVFFKLPYWKENIMPHNLDIMHIEKNVCESLTGTLLNMDRKSKDGLKARRDLQLKGLRPELHPKEAPNGKTVLPPACFTLKKEDKVTFCKFLKKVKVPDGYASNISRCIKDKTVYGLKSHDGHILMQQLLHLAVRGMLNESVNSCIIELSNFFREMYSKVKRPKDYLELEEKISITLCKMEKIFPPSFFDICVHLLVHLPAQARLAGPVQYREMYPIERYLLKLKSYVRNRNQPEGSIAEAYLVDECLTFCSRYMDGVVTRLNRLQRNNDDAGVVEDVLPIFSMPGRPMGKGHTTSLNESTRSSAQQYILSNCAELEEYRRQHLVFLLEQYPRMRPWHREKLHSKEFQSWFKSQDGHNPFLELTLSARKRISSVVRHLNARCGSSSVVIGHLMLFPYNTMLEQVASCKTWTLNDSAITAWEVKNHGSKAIYLAFSLAMILHHVSCLLDDTIFLSPVT